MIASAGCLLEGTPGFTGGDAGTGNPSETGATDDGTTLDGSTTGTGDLPQPAIPRGVLEHACGLDLDDDGVFGTGDDCKVCAWDENVEPPRDPDGDGIDERMMWVDCDEGIDDGDCRDRGVPCASLNYALDMLPARADADNFESIVCFTGTCQVNAGLRLPSGLVGGVTRNGFDYPRDPLMIIGADADGDEQYPPWDKDDVAEIVASPDGLDAVLFSVDSTVEGIGRDIELAHFTITADPVDLRLLRNRNGPAIQRLYLHDLELVGFRSGETDHPESPLFELAGAGATEQYFGSQILGFALENTKITGFGGAIIRANTATGVEQGAIRIANVDARANGCDATTCTNYYDDSVLLPEGAKVSILDIFGEHHSITVVDSIFDAQTDQWTPYGGDGSSRVPLTAFTFGQCTSNITLRNNEIRGFGTALRLEATSNAKCEGAGVDDVRFEGNLVIGNDGASRLNTATIIPIDIRSRSLGNAEPEANVGRVELLNNAIVPLEPSAACIAIAASLGGAPSGPFLLHHNTCVIDLDPEANEGAVLRVWGDVAIDAFDLRNSLLLADPGTPTVRVGRLGADWIVDGNVLGADPTFLVEGVDESLGTWQARGFDASSAMCTPTFLEADGYHLEADDACAVDRGLADVALMTDIDGDARDATPDVGADELVQ